VRTEAHREGRGGGDELRGGGEVRAAFVVVGDEQRYPLAELGEEHVVLQHRLHLHPGAFFLPDATCSGSEAVPRRLRARREQRERERERALRYVAAAGLWLALRSDERAGALIARRPLFWCHQFEGWVWDQHRKGRGPHECGGRGPCTCSQSAPFSPRSSLGARPPHPIPATGRPDEAPPVR
jgi:hypothetical protein